jgi:hypothetical protein
MVGASCRLCCVNDSGYCACSRCCSHHDAALSTHVLSTQDETRYRSELLAYLPMHSMSNAAISAGAAAAAADPGLHQGCRRPVGVELRQPQTRHGLAASIHQQRRLQVRKNETCLACYVAIALHGVQLTRLYISRLTVLQPSSTAAEHGLAASIHQQRRLQVRQQLLCPFNSVADQQALWCLTYVFAC